MKNIKEQYTFGVALVLLAAGLNGLLPLMVTTVYEFGGHFSNIMFYKAVFLVPAAFLICRIQKISLRTTLGQQVACGAIALFQFATSLLLYGSYNLISTGTATTLHFMYPVAVSILAMLFFHEKPHRGECLSLGLCIVGVILLCGATTGKNENLLGILVALLSGVIYAGYLMIMGRSPTESLPSMVFMLYVFLYKGIFSGIVSVFFRTLKGLGEEGWGMMAVSSVAAGIVAVALQRGISVVGSQTASVLCAAEPFVSVLAGVIVLHEPFSIRSACGTLCIIIAVVSAAFAKKKEKDEVINR